jgi:hypothetical protein
VGELDFEWESKDAGDENYLTLLQRLTQIDEQS